jgi:hypothetical protein
MANKARSHVQQGGFIAISRNKLTMLTFGSPGTSADIVVGSSWLKNGVALGVILLPHVPLQPRYNCQWLHYMAPTYANSGTPRPSFRQQQRSLWASRHGQAVGAGCMYGMHRLLRAALRLSCMYCSILYKFHAILQFLKNRVTVLQIKTCSQRLFVQPQAHSSIAGLYLLSLPH